MAGVADTATNALQLAGMSASGFIQNTTSQQSATNFNIGGTGTASILNATTQFNLGGSRILSNPGTTNLFAGVNAGASNTTGSNNSFFGRDAGISNTMGINNSFYGYSAGHSNTTPSGNSFFGSEAGRSNTTGQLNAFFGARAGRSNTTAEANSFFGHDAGSSNTTGIFNSFFGKGAGRANTTSDANSFFGNTAGFSNTEGSNNSFLGSSAGISNTTGNNNTFVGTFAGVLNATGSDNTAIGRGTTFGADNLTFATVIGAGAVVNTSNTIVLGRHLDSVRIPGGISGNLGIGPSAPATKLHISGVEEGIRIQGPMAGDGNLAYLSFVDSAGTSIGFVGDASAVSKDVYLFSDSGVVLRTAAGDGLRLDPTGSIVMSGGTGSIPGNHVAAQNNPNGSLDTSFDTDGKVTTPIGAGSDSGAAVVLQSDGKIVVAGFSSIGTTFDFAVARYNTDGSLDTSFDSDGKLITPISTGEDQGTALAIQTDGKIVVAGTSLNGTNNDFAVVRYNPNGSLDTSYGTGGKVIVAVTIGSDSVGGVALDSLDRAIVVGEADGLLGVVRILGDTQPACNYSLSPAGDYMSARGGPCSFNVSVGAGCQWTAQTSDPWIVITSDPSGAGNGSVSLEIRDNFTSSARLGTVTLGGETFTIVQEGRNTSCGYTITPQFAAYQVSGGSSTINITTSAGCGWRAVSTQNWIEITSTEVGIGNATISYTVSTNTTGGVRDGAIVLGGQSFKVKQKGS
jgi:uncharacterized delta-60 repeat protein